MKKSGILNADLNAHISRLAHTDLFVVADSGFPVMPGIPIVDLRLVYGVPTFDQVFEAVLNEVEVEGGWLASEMAEGNRANYDLVTGTLHGLTLITHDGLKTLAHGARFVIRTGEDTPYSNVLLQSGVGFLVADAVSVT